MHPDSLLAAAANVAAIWPRISKAVEAREQQSAETSPIDLSTSENWLIRGELINLYKNAVQDNLSSQHLSYPDGFNGDSGLTRALAEFFNSWFSPVIPVEVPHLAVAPGAAFALDTLLYNICDPSDGILISTPSWNGFDWLIDVRSSVKPIFNRLQSLDDVFSLRILDSLQEAFDQSQTPIKALLLTNPHNPLGQAYPKDVIIAVLNFCNDKQIHFISDEIYAMTRFENPDLPRPVSFTSALQLDVQQLGCDLSRVHTIWSTSKDLGSSGLRVGCCITQGNKPLATGLALASNTQTSSLAAIATASLLSSPVLHDLLSSNAQRLSEAYTRMTAVLKKHNIQYIPANQTPFLFAKVAPRATTWEQEEAFGEAYKQAGVAISLGRAYHVPEGEKGWARLNFAVEPQSLVEALNRLDQVLGRRSTEMEESQE
ncbi:PLP-dependent transferase [Xylaria bambusicola]|uniref:PLP-dependent transferase n=1 Tax=Xylaria bambusicola TaxID=326684 RepID=UPI002008C34F|nr:PLP-dependent transferase [Xylaria bambusicola]KAI0508609.1 PLP-dependent transferase [Xylaria bambusicola]